MYRSLDALVIHMGSFKSTPQGIERHSLKDNTFQCPLQIVFFFMIQSTKCFELLITLFIATSKLKLYNLYINLTKTTTLLCIKQCNILEHRIDCLMIHTISIAILKHGFYDLELIQLNNKAETILFTSQKKYIDQTVFLYDIYHEL